VGTYGSISLTAGTYLILANVNIIGGITGYTFSISDSTSPTPPIDYTSAVQDNVCNNASVTTPICAQVFKVVTITSGATTYRLLGSVTYANVSATIVVTNNSRLYAIRLA
jgi:hypothetical protein